MSQYTLLVYIVGECLHPLTFSDGFLGFFYVWIFIRKNKEKFKGNFHRKFSL